MIGIIGAMEAEVAILKDTMEIEEVVCLLYTSPSPRDRG